MEISYKTKGCPVVLVSKGTGNNTLESCEVLSFITGGVCFHSYQAKGLASSHWQLFGQPRFPGCHSETSLLGIHLEAGRLDVMNAEAAMSVRFYHKVAWVIPKWYEMNNPSVSVSRWRPDFMKSNYWEEKYKPVLSLRKHKLY